MSNKPMAKILIVEDEVITAMDLENILQKLGYEIVSTASTGREALQKVEKYKPDLVLMDIVLKGDMDGIEVTRKIHTIFDIPVVNLTAYSDKKTLNRAKSTKPYGFLTKPVNPDGLEASIETALYNYELDKKLRIREEKYRRIVETANEGIWSTDKNYITTFVNSRITEILGYKTEEMLGKPFKSFMFTEDLEDHKNKINNRKQGNSDRYEWKFRHKNGSKVWAVVSASPVMDKDGNFAGSFAMFTDITKQKKAEEDLKENQAKYQALIETNVDFIWEMDAKGRYTYCSPQMESLCGLKPGNMIGKTPFDMMPEEEREHAAKQFIQAASSLSEFSGIESTSHNNQGNIIYVETSGVPFFDAEGLLLGYRGITRDITERKKIQNSLKESKELYQMLFENSQVCTAITRMNGEVFAANPNFFEMTGYEQEEIGQLNLRTMYQDINQRNALIEILKKEGKVRNYEVKMTRRNGQPYMASINVDLIHYHHEDAMMVTAIDITEQKKSQIALRCSESRLRELFNNISSGVAVYEAGNDVSDFIIKDFNKAAEKIENIKKEDIIGKSVFEVFAGIKDFGLFEVLQRVWKTGVPEHFSTSFYQDERINGWRDNYIYKLPTEEIVAVYDDVTEQINAEEALKESEEKFRALAENSPDIISRMDNELRYIYINHGSETLGLSPEELIGKKLEEIAPSKKITDIWIEKSKEVLKTGKNQELEFEFPSIHGLKIYHAYLIPECNSKGEMETLLAVSRDITERKKAEEELKLVSNYNRSLIETSLDPFVTIGTDRKITDLNKSTEAITGQSRDEIIGTYFCNYFTEPEKARKGYDQVLEKGEVRDYPLEIKHKNGHVTPVLYNASVYKNESGEVIGVFAAAHDITNRKIAEEKTINEHQKLLDIIEFLPDATFVIDEDKKIIAWNKAIENMTGISKDKMIGKGNYEYSIPFYGARKPLLTDLIFLENEEIESRYDFVKREGKTLFAEIFLSNLFDGRGAYLLLKASPLYDNNGNIVGAIESIRDVTERKEIEQVLKESEEKYRWLFEASPLYLIFVGSDGCLIDINEAASDFAGVSRENLIGKHFFELEIIPQDELPLHQENVSRILKGERIEPYESRYIDKNGEIHYAVTHDKYVKKDGEIVAFQIIFFDITEHKKAEKALVESEEKYRDLVESLPQPVYESDLAGNITFSNRVGLEIFGFNQEDVDKGLNMAQILAPEDHHRAMEDIQKTLNGEESVIEYNALKKDGTILPIIVYSNPIFHENKIVGSRGVLIDLTELKRHEEKLELLNKNLMESEERFRALIDNSTSIIRILDKDGLIVFDSPSSSRILGYPNGYFIGKNPLDFIHPDDKLKVSNDLKETFENRNKGIPTEFRIKKADGTYHPFESIAQNLINIPGIEGILVFTNSILIRKESEDKIKKSLKEKEVLLQEIHHRVKNNMQIISSLLNLQKEQVDGVEAVNVLQESQNRVKSMALIHEKLYKSNSLIKINFRDYIHELVNDLFFSYGIKDDRIAWVYDMEDIMLNIETAIPLGLIVSELVSNSLKYAFPKGKKGKIFVGLKSIDDYIELRISDDGVGFPEGLDYKNLDTLGLLLVNKLVNQIDGKIDIDGSKGVDLKVKFKELKYKERI